jgi:hypothetical protein
MDPRDLELGIEVLEGNCPTDGGDAWSHQAFSISSLDRFEALPGT